MDRPTCGGGGAKLPTLSCLPEGNSHIYGTSRYPMVYYPPGGGDTRVHRDSLRCHTNYGDAGRGNWSVDSILVTSPHPLPQIFGEVWVRYKEGINFLYGLHWSSLTVPINEYSDVSAQCSGLCPVVDWGNGEGDPSVHDAQGLLQYTGCAPSILLLWLGGCSPKVCEQYILSRWYHGGTERKLRAPPEVTLLIPLRGKLETPQNHSMVFVVSGVLYVDVS